MPGGTRRGDRGRDDVDLLAPQVPALAGVGIEPADGDARRRDRELRGELGADDASVAATASRVTAAGTSLSARWVVTSATRSGASCGPPTSIITTRGVCVRCAKYSVCPVKGMPASMKTLFCTGAVTSAANIPVAHASDALASEARTLCALVGSGWPGLTGAANG